MKSQVTTDTGRGFLPVPDPLQGLPERYAAWEEAARELPKSLGSGQVRSILSQLPPIEASDLADEPERERAMLLLSYFGHAYVWGEPEPAQQLPECIARPWYQVSTQLGRPPVLSYASYALANWKRLDETGPIALGNIALLQNFLGGLDEEWFVLVHVEVEMRAARACAAVPAALEAAANNDVDSLERQLRAMAASLEDVNATLMRMTERCDPYIYYNRVRPYIHGWRNHPALPEGVRYEGVAAYGDKPQQFRGETGAQSSIVPALDAALGIVHRDDPLLFFLHEMRAYMPSEHRAFIQRIERFGGVREFVLHNHARHRPLGVGYNRCIEQICQFRSTHLEFAETYIDRQKEVQPSNPTQVGTGGTPFLAYLRKHRDETKEHVVDLA